MTSRDRARNVKYIVNNIDNMITNLVNEQGEELINAICRSGLPWKTVSQIIITITDLSLRDCNLKIAREIAVRFALGITEDETINYLRWFNDNRYNDIETKDGMKYMICKFSENVVLSLGAKREDLY